MVAELGTLAGEIERDETIGTVVLHGAHPDRFLAHFDVGELLAGARAGGARLSHRQASVALRAVAAAARIPGGERMVQRSPAARMLDLARFHELMLRINRVGATVIAAIDGSALGGGCELALACDLRFMADGDFVIGQPEILLGIILGGGGTQRLARLLGSGKALELTLEGTALSPDQALDIGLINRVIPPDQLLQEAIDTAHRLARRPRVAVAAAKRAVYEGGSLSLPDGLNQPNVDLRTDGVAEVREHSIVTEAGTKLEIDTIIFGTGFHTVDAPIAHRLRGRSGRTLAEHWNGSMRGYKGTTIAGFPNLFYMLGPNTGLGHNSIIYTVESQVAYVLDALHTLEQRDAHVFDVHQAAETRYDDTLQHAMQNTVWTAGNCHSWYLDDTGRNPTLWPTWSWSYRKDTSGFDAEAYEITT